MTRASSKVLSRLDLVLALDHDRAAGRRIVSTNGCFDILHLGHARYLAEAKSHGDLLVVGVNSDRSVVELKGEGRPIVPERERAELLAHLEDVDYVCIFDELRPNALLNSIRPHVHIKGGDYRVDDLPEAEVVRKHGGEVVVVSLLAGHSTTDVIARIQSAVETEN